MFFKRVTSRFGRLAAMSAFIGLAGMAATVAQAQTHFRGGGWASNFVGCEAIGWTSQSLMILARYRPAELQGNAGSGLSLFPYGGAEHYFTGGPLQFNFQPMGGVFVWTGAGQIQPDPVVRVLSRNPRVITEETGEIQMRLRIRNFGVHQGCRADVGIVMTRVPPIQN